MQICHSKFKLIVIQLLVAGFVCVMFTANASAAPVYIIEEASGVTTFTSRKPPAGTRYRTVTGRISGKYSTGGRARFAPKPMDKTKYDELISGAAKEHRLDPSLLKAVIHVESAFYSLARSHKGAMGLMQLMPGTARRFGVWDAYNPEQNIGGGSKYLKFLLDRYNGNLVLAVAAYNAGEGAVDQYRNIPPYSETQSYVRKVLATLKAYRCVQQKQTNCGV